MDCKDIQEALPSLLYGELDDAAAKPILAHLKTCAQCRELSEDLKHTLTLLHQWQEVELPLNRSEISDLERWRNGSFNLKRHPWIKPLIAALAAGLLLVVTLALAGVEVRKSPSGLVIALGKDALAEPSLPEKMASDFKEMIRGEMEEELGGLFQAVVHHLEVVSRDMKEREHLLVDALKMQREQDMQATQDLVCRMAADSKVELERTRRYLDEIANLVWNEDAPNPDASPGSGKH
ncbi:MAG: zf-HC2 domain-containing protein [Planctomycetes bacterium]|nr:zf-HC2 domain-containing protein [Planctomycetota bacterium]